MAREPPTERAEPENRAMQQRQALGERVAAGDVRNFVREDGVEFRGFPIAPAGGKQNRGAAHAECYWHGEQLRFSQARRRCAQAGCAREKMQAREGVRVFDQLRFSFQAPAQDYAERQAHQHEDCDREIDCSRGCEPRKWATGLRVCSRRIRGLRHARCVRRFGRVRRIHRVRRMAGVGECAKLRGARMRYLIDADRAGMNLGRRRDFRGRLRGNELRGQRHKHRKRRQQQTEQRHRERHEREPSRQMASRRATLRTRKAARTSPATHANASERAAGCKTCAAKFAEASRTGLTIMTSPPCAEWSCARRFSASGARAGGGRARRCPPCR